MILMINTNNNRKVEYILCTCKMSLCLCKVCISAALCDEAPGVFVYSAILSLTAVSCQEKDKTDIKWT